MNEIEKINPKEYGLEEPKANELTTGLGITLKERKLLIDEFNTISKLEVNKKNIPKFKELRLRIVKNRTQGIVKWHTSAKNYFLKGGQFVDAIKRQEIAVNELMEEKLISAEKHFENIEKERLIKLQNDRASKLSKYVEDAEERNLSAMDDDVWDAYYFAKKKEYEDRIIAEKKAEKEEQERIQKENERLRKEAEEAEAKRIKEEKERQRIAKIEADKLEADRKEQERIRLENEARVKAELKRLEAEKQRLIAIEKAKTDKLEAELEAKKQAEIKAENDRLAEIESEAKKGDSAKVRDLINDLNIIKTNYQFKSKKNQKMYADVSILIDKIINHIEK